VNSAQTNCMSQRQIALLDRALAILSKLDEGGWHEIPLDLRVSFAKYMEPDMWTRLPDVLTLREAALMIVRDAIARTGEFSAASGEQSGNDRPPLKAFAA
jgi:hypothetical protein